MTKRETPTWRNTSVNPITDALYDAYDLSQHIFGAANAINDLINYPAETYGHVVKADIERSLLDPWRDLPTSSRNVDPDTGETKERWTVAERKHRRQQLEHERQRRRRKRLPYLPAHQNLSTSIKEQWLDQLVISTVDTNVRNLIPSPNDLHRDVSDVAELADDIKEQSLQQTLVITPNHEEYGGRLSRVAIGHRHLAAYKLAGLESVPYAVRGLDAKIEHGLTLVENCQRFDLTPLEEADGYQGLLNLGVNVGELASKTGRSESSVHGRLQIARIPAGMRSGSKAFTQLSLARLDELTEFEDRPDMMVELASMAGTRNWDWKRGQLWSRMYVEGWQKRMHQVLDGLGLVVGPGPSIWTTPAGYRYYGTWSSEPDEFKQWCGRWREKNPYGEPMIRFSECNILYFSQMSPEEIAKRDTDSEQRERRNAEDRALLVRRQDFDALVRDLHAGWIKTYAAEFNGGQLRKANTRLSLLVLTGTDLCDDLIAEAGWGNLDHMLDAYNPLTTTPLPCDNKRDREVWREQNLAKLRRRQHVGGVYLLYTSPSPRDAIYGIR